MEIYIDLANVLKEKNVSKNKICMECAMQRTQLNKYCRNEMSRVDLAILGRLCEYLDCTPNDILKMKKED